MTAKLVLARHAQSEGNLKNIFTGLSDLPLSDHGRDEALDIAARLRDAGIRPAVVYTSALSRTRETAVILLDALGIDATMIADPALNERDYGDLTGMNKAEAVARFGADRVLSWRRSYDDRPPGGESLADTRSRVWPFFENVIAPHLQAAENVLVIAHGNSLRSLVMGLETLSVDEVQGLEIATGEIVVYEMESTGGKFQPTRKSPRLETDKPGPGI